jgi:DNA-nicking Smr family endonuclease
MSHERNDTPRPRRRLSPDEHRLWNGIVRSVSPLRRRPPVPPPVEIVAAGDEPAPPARRRFEPAPVRQAATKSAPKLAPKPAPPLAPLDRRQKQRLARGAEPIDGRIDLHGRTQSEAHAALLGFLRGAQRDGARFVLVITGKGETAPDFSGTRGVLKRQVPLWLRLPEFRGFVLSIEDAHAAHGGGGALYVRLRRGRGG